MAYEVKVTKIRNGYGCRIFYDEKLVVEGRCDGKEMIGPTCRDLMRTLDKCNGDAFTSASRKRKFKAGNLCASVKHIWSR